MPVLRARRVLLAVLILLTCSTTPTPADEGMWPLNRLQTAIVQQAVGVTLTPQWLQHAQLASVRLAGGCSGSFVSPSGLVMTNYHCAVQCVEALSSTDRNLSQTGFLAADQAGEQQCPGVEVNQLTAITDVTARVTAAVDGKEGEQFEAARKAVVATLESECATGKDVRCDVVTLYHGGKYDLYKYRRFQDVRLVFAPEFAIGFFGGDPDNFMFPRYNLDLAFLRVYDGGQPLRSPQYFPWSPSGAKAGDPVFITGHPGGTSRLYTVAQLEFDRDVSVPTYLMMLSEMRGLLTEFQRRGAEQARVSGSQLVFLENSLKVYRGQFATLTDPQLVATKEAEEAKLRQAVASDPALAARYGGSWEALATLMGRARDLWPRYTTLTLLAQSQLFSHARRLLRLPVERAKSNTERLPAYTDAALPALEQQVAAKEPISKELETVLLAFALDRVRQRFGPDHEITRALLGTRSPQEVATEAVTQSTLDEASARVALMKGGAAAVEASSDPMLRLARAVDAADRALRAQYENEIQAEVTRHSTNIAQARFAVLGDRVYPDATFTLRLTYGRVRGWTEEGKPVEPFTTFAGAYRRHTGSAPFKLPQRWLDAKPRVALDTPLNLVSDTDIIGGNSGSPLLNRDAQVVGLAFDGNIHAIGGEYWFDPAKNRTVSVDSRGMREALASVYQASRIVREIDAAAAPAKAARLTP